MLDKCYQNRKPKSDRQKTQKHSVRIKAKRNSTNETRLQRSVDFAEAFI